MPVIIIIIICIFYSTNILIVWGKYSYFSMLKYLWSVWQILAIGRFLSRNKILQ